MDEQPNNPLHGVTLKALLEELVERHGFEELGRRVRIRCFNQDPSIRSSLKFLRKTPWARAEVEQLWLADQQVVQRNRRRNQRRAAMRAHRREVEAAGGIVRPLSTRGEDPSEGEQESAEGNHDPAEGKPDRDEGKPDRDEGKRRQTRAKPALKPGKKGDLPTW